MSTFLSHDLTIARQKAGLTRSDVKHLTGINIRALQRIEQGQSVPSVRDVAALALIYDRTFESSIDDLLHHLRRQIKRRLPRIPDPPEEWQYIVKRRATLKRLHDRLEAIARADGRA